MRRYFIMDTDSRTVRRLVSSLHQLPQPVQGLFWNWTRIDVELGRQQAERFDFKIQRKHISPFAVLNRGMVKGTARALNTHQTLVSLHVDNTAMWLYGWMMLIWLLVVVGVSALDPEAPVLFFALLIPISVLSWAMWFAYNYWRLTILLKNAFGAAFENSVRNRDQLENLIQNVIYEGKLS